MCPNVNNTEVVAQFNAIVQATRRATSDDRRI